jgi:hypothetical protein
LALKFGEDSADGRPTAGGLRALKLSTGEALDCVMSSAGSNHGADDGKFVHHPSHFWEEFSNLDAWDVGGDGIKFSTNTGGSFGFNVPHILVWRAASEKNHDDRLVFELLRRGCLSLEQLRKGGSAEAESPDAEKATACHSIAESFAFGSGYCE